MDGPTAATVKPSGLERAAGWASMGAGLVHGGLAPEHFRVWVGYGLFFIAAALAQVVFGLALLTSAINPKDFGAGWSSFKRAFLVAGVAGNLFLLVFYVVTRTSGIPWFGPERGTVEEVAPLDLIAKAFEACVIVLLVWILARRDPRVATS